MLNPRLRLLGFAGAYLRSNFQIALEYRASFWAQVLSMALNDAMWVAFWAIFFTRFDVVRGYGFLDVVTVWAVAAVAFGLATGIFGNCWRFAQQVAQGSLDFYLVLPKPVLLHLLISHMEWSAWGDVLFGLAAYAVIVQPSPADLAIFLLLCLFATSIVVAYGTITNSLAFWLGNSETVTGQGLQALLIFSTYPGALFTGPIKVVLYTVIPAGFVTYVPVGLLREWDWALAAGLAAASAAFLALAVAIFYAGLKRYESGNLLAMRG